MSTSVPEPSRHLPTLTLEQIEPIATGRDQSLFSGDIARNHAELTAAYSGRRIAVIGAAGSIGFSVLKALLPYAPAAMALIDLSENNLVEVVRDLRSSPGLVTPKTFEALPIGLGSLECRRYFEESAPFDCIFNLSAIKHVRSEKDVYSLIRMMDTNCLFLADFLNELPYATRVFSVSSDKAVNPASLMGASKLAMERVLAVHAGRHTYSTARFANVAFSDGSLPHGFLKRLQKRQPLSAPHDVRRFFISHQEAGQLCVLAAGLGRHGETLIPKLDERLDAHRFDDIARRLLTHLGYTPVEYDSELAAREECAALIAQGRWPCVFSSSDTSGEKPYEEFAAESDLVDFDRFSAIGVIAPATVTADDRAAVTAFLDFLRAAKTDVAATVDDYADAMSKVVAGFSHVKAGRSLDQKM